MSSHDISIVFYKSKLELMVIFQFWCSLKGKSGIHHFETSKKIAFWWVWHLTLRVTKKFSVGIQYPTCVLASFLRIISICWNKREHHTTLQSYFTIQNVSWWWFFSFDTPSKVKLAYFKLIRNFESLWLLIIEFQKIMICKNWRKGF